MKYLLTFILFLSVAVPAYASIFGGQVTTGVSTGNGMEGIVVEAPTASPVAGSYTGTQNITLSGGDGTVSIHYTDDGSSVSCTTGNTYSTPIVASTSLFIEAISCYANGVVSPTIIFAYVISNSPPTTAPSGGGGGGGGGTITTPSTASYDFNSDGKIDVIDFNILIVNWGSTGAPDKTTGDANGDGNVDIFDFNLLIINWQS